MTEQKLAQYSKLPEMEEQLKARMEALNQVGTQVGRVEDVLLVNITIQYFYRYKVFKLPNNVVLLKNTVHPLLLSPVYRIIAAHSRNLCHF